jgi:hypothetical protein
VGNDAHLVQILLPLWDPDGERFPHAMYARVKDELAQGFGGLTADEELDSAWWTRYRQELGQRCRQQELVVRALAISRL